MVHLLLVLKRPLKFITWDNRFNFLNNNQTGYKVDTNWRGGLKNYHLESNPNLMIGFFRNPNRALLGRLQFADVYIYVPSLLSPFPRSEYQAGPLTYSWMLQVCNGSYWPSGLEQPAPSWPGQLESYSFSKLRCSCPPVPIINMQGASARLVLCLHIAPGLDARVTASPHTHTEVALCSVTPDWPPTAAATIAAGQWSSAPSGDIDSAAFKLTVGLPAWVPNLNSSSPSLVTQAWIRYFGPQ